MRFWLGLCHGTWVGSVSLMFDVWRSFKGAWPVSWGMDRPCCPQKICIGSVPILAILGPFASSRFINVLFPETKKGNKMHINELNLIKITWNRRENTQETWYIYYLSNTPKIKSLLVLKQQDYFERIRIKRFFNS